MLSGIDGFTSTFLADLNATEARITKENQQLSSGYRVSEASDDPSAVTPILQTQAEIDRVTQVQTNLNTASANASAVDGALQSASQLMDQLVSLASNGASTSVDADTRATLAQQVQQIQQQLVSLANTSVQGQYIFGGDEVNTQPYTLDSSQSDGVVANNTSQSTTILRDANGNTIVPSFTARQIFDDRDSNGNPTSGNIFSAVYSLSQSLQNNDTTGIQNALDSLKSADSHLNQITAASGNVETWIQQASTDASQRITTLTQSLTSLQDADIPSVITQLTTDQTALQTSLSAHGSFTNKSLFSYLG